MHLLLSPTQCNHHQGWSTSLTDEADNQRPIIVYVWIKACTEFYTSWCYTVLKEDAMFQHFWCRPCYILPQDTAQYLLPVVVWGMVWWSASLWQVKKMIIFVFRVLWLPCNCLRWDWRPPLCTLLLQLQAKWFHNHWNVIIKNFYLLLPTLVLVSAIFSRWYMFVLIHLIYLTCNSIFDMIKFSSFFTAFISSQVVKSCLYGLFKLPNIQPHIYVVITL